MTQELVKELLDRIASGEYVEQICQDDHMPHHTTVFRWLAKDAEFASQYTLAKKHHADALEDQMARIERDVESGLLDPNAARVVLQSRQWRAGRLSPSKYSDRQIIQGDKTADPVQHSVALDFSGLSDSELRVLQGILEARAGQDSGQK